MSKLNTSRVSIERFGHILGRKSRPNSVADRPRRDIARHVRRPRPRPTAVPRSRTNRPATTALDRHSAASTGARSAMPAPGGYGPDRFDHPEPGPGPACFTGRPDGIRMQGLPGPSRSGR